MPEMRESNWTRATQRHDRCPHCGNDRTDLIEVLEEREQCYCGVCAKTWPFTRSG